ncbi:MAG: endopeptidase La [Planctomycetes bacterium]|nr:endopeptidase La [Planctomycetota bacterium]
MRKKIRARTAPKPRPRQKQSTKRKARVPKTQRLILLPVRNAVIFPGVVLPFGIGRERSLRGMQEAVRRSRPIGIVMQRNPAQDDPGAKDLHEIGTLVEVLRFVSTEESGHHAVCQGRSRFKILSVEQVEPYMLATVQHIEEKVVPDAKMQARFVALKAQAREALALMPGAPDELPNVVQNVGSPVLLADMVATFLDIPPLEKQELLEMLDVGERLAAVQRRLGHMIEVLKLSRDIRSRTKGVLDKAQREYYLREELKTIQKELGEENAQEAEMERLSEGLAKAGLPEAALAEAHKELARLRRMPQSSAEYGMLRTWIEMVIDLPWQRSSTDSIELANAREVLEADHYGLDKVKRRILEFLAVRKLKPEGKSPILCLVGPPGVGKTSLGQSIARAMGRKFVRLSLGGVHDEAEIRGHRRTYIGAMPGLVLQSLKKAGTNNPVFLLDEIDKLGRGPQGDPSSALLEVLDPEQNNTFRDNYLNLPFDLRKVMFVATANVEDDIPPPLRDRCEVLRLPGYVEEEKLAIAQQYLVPRQIAENGLASGQCAISEDALQQVIRRYTREAGVRSLEREIAALARRAAMRVAEGETAPTRWTMENVHEVLGPPRFESEVLLRTASSGVATGLAWTPVGGEVLFVEATRMPGKGNLALTGKLGDVMKESAQAAYSLVRANAGQLGIKAQSFEKFDVHMHVPSGAIPKDGPSAGVTMYTALVSLFTGRLVRNDVAMTGEISLRGLVLPVGGIREKVLAALAAGIRKVILPARNKHDWEEVPAKARAELTPVWVERVEEVLEHALAGSAQAPQTPSLFGAAEQATL